MREPFFSFFAKTDPENGNSSLRAHHASGMVSTMNSQVLTGVQTSLATTNQADFWREKKTRRSLHMSRLFLPFHSTL